VQIAPHREQSGSARIPFDGNSYRREV